MQKKVRRASRRRRARPSRLVALLGWCWKILRALLVAGAAMGPAAPPPPPPPPPRIEVSADSGQEADVE
jgi:hypothetical protein